MTDSPRTPIGLRIYRWVGVAALLVCIGILTTREHCLRWIGMSLVNEESIGTSDAILIDNVGPRYLLFERAQELQSRGLAEVVLVPVLKSDNADQPAIVSLGFINVMCRISRVRHTATFDVLEREPIDLNVAKRSAEQLQARGARSVIVITGGFGSRRAAEVYRHVLKPLGINVYIQPVFGLRTPDNWSESWHGFQEIGLQLGSLWYYRLAVL
jgi:hypothetical protein